MISRQLDAYTKALIPEPYIILGVPLRPLSLGHIFLMRRFDCGFASEDKSSVGGIDDLILGIAICSRTYEGFLEFLQDPEDFQQWTAKWGKAIRKEVKRNNGIFDLYSRFIMFREYLNAGIVIPKFWEMQSDDGGESGTHWTHSVFSILTSELGYSQTEALNAPVARALADYYRFLERNGVITLMTDAEIEMIESGQSSVTLTPKEEVKEETKVEEPA